MAGQDYNPDGTTFPEFPWTLVKDGEVYNFDSIQQSSDPKRGLFAKCMQAIAYLRAKVDGYLSPSYHYPLSTRTVTRVQQAPMTLLVTGLTTHLAFVSCPVGDAVYQALLVPHGATLKGVSVTIDPSSHTALPANMPKFEVKKMNVTTEAITSIGSVTDTTATTAGYADPHALAISGLNEVIDRENCYYYAVCSGEGSTNASSMLVLACKTTTEIKGLDDSY